MKKISLIGAGNIGGTLASIIINKNLGDIFLIDVLDGLAQGKALDLEQSSILQDSSCKISGSNKLDDIKDSDVIIVTAGIARKPGMSRDDLIETNFNIMREIGSAIKKNCPNAFVVCVTNPLDAMVWTLQKTSGIKKNMITGMAGILDSTRFKCFLANKLNISSKNIDSIVLGGHGDTMVPLLGYTTINGIPLSDFIENGSITREAINKIVDRTRNGGGEIVGLLKNYSAFYAPAYSAIEMAESYLMDQKKVLPCSSLLNGEYGFDDVFIGVPVIIGKDGVEKIIELNFSEVERENFRESVNAVEELIKKCKKLLV